jgi:hypothetical protein
VSGVSRSVPEGVAAAKGSVGEDTRLMGGGARILRPVGLSRLCSLVTVGGGAETNCWVGLENTSGTSLRDPTLINLRKSFAYHQVTIILYIHG